MQNHGITICTLNDNIQNLIILFEQIFADVLNLSILKYNNLCKHQIFFKLIKTLLELIHLNN